MMCNHYRNDPSQIPTWREYIGADVGPAAEAPDEDVWPRRAGYVVRTQNDTRTLDLMHWGVPMTIPGKRPGTTVTKVVTNVRNLQSPFWKSMLMQPAQRCLVPFSSFAEPKIGEGRAEHWFSVREGSVACFAGIWRNSPAGNVYAFLTCEPNPLVAPLHPKAMPVILDPDDYEKWLTGDYTEACSLAVPFPSQLMSVV
jgi:putative SOS response-associated peptidase YedK